MTERHCQQIEVDGESAIACGPRITKGDMEVIREFSEFLKGRGKWHEMANPRTAPENGDTRA
ncbi:hypothetical protein [Nocardia carnea]|uniref:hypothetical protein n=1 Tax=Nocardia carnea TaxID=37328 RepID=UPI002458F553|nr:hypothetical protein [Nocardia carnea]